MPFFLCPALRVAEHLDAIEHVLPRGFRRSLSAIAEYAEA